MVPHFSPRNTAMTARLGLCFFRVRQNQGGPLSKSYNNRKESFFDKRVKVRFAYLAIELSDPNHKQTQEIDFPNSDYKTSLPIPVNQRIMKRYFIHVAWLNLVAQSSQEPLIVIWPIDSTRASVSGPGTAAHNSSIACAKCSNASACIPMSSRYRSISAAGV